MAAARGKTEKVDETIKDRAEVSPVATHSDEQCDNVSFESPQAVARSEIAQRDMATVQNTSGKSNMNIVNASNVEPTNVCTRAQSEVVSLTVETSTIIGEHGRNTDLLSDKNKHKSVNYTLSDKLKEAKKIVDVKRSHSHPCRDPAGDIAGPSDTRVSRISTVKELTICEPLPHSGVTNNDDVIGQRMLSLRSELLNAAAVNKRVQFVGSRLDVSLEKSHFRRVPTPYWARSPAGSRDSHDEPDLVLLDRQVETAGKKQTEDGATDGNMLPATGRTMPDFVVNDMDDDE